MASDTKKRRPRAPQSSPSSDAVPDEDWMQMLRKGRIGRTIIQAIHDYRAGLGLSYRQMGEMLGISHSTLIKWEQGTVNRCRVEQRRRLRWFMMNRSKKLLSDNQLDQLKESQDIASRWLKDRKQIVAVAHLCRLSPKLYQEYCDALRELYLRYEEKYSRQE